VLVGHTDEALGESLGAREVVGQRQAGSRLSAVGKEQAGDDLVLADVEAEEAG
jgi:hypothetical protein